MTGCLSWTRVVAEQMKDIQMFRNQLTDVRTGGQKSSGRGSISGNHCSQLLYKH